MPGEVDVLSEDGLFGPAVPGAVDLLAASSKECTYSDRHALVLPAHRIATRNVVGTMTGRVVGANNGCKLRYANGREEAAGSLRHP